MFQVLPGSQLLSSAVEQGNIAVKDLRMLGGPTPPTPKGAPQRGLPPPTPTLTSNPASSWGSHSSNAAAR